MIISHAKKFVFVHTYKTAGSSVSVRLIDHVPHTDLFIGGIPEAYRAGTLTVPRYLRNIGTFRYLPFFLKASLGTRSIGDGLSLAGKIYYRKRGLFSHSTAAELREYLGHDTWNTYFTFAFERNPWDKVVSAYHWLGKHHDTSHYPFDDFVSAYINGFDIFSGKRIKHPIDHLAYTDGQTVLVDHLARFEELETEISYICNRLQLPYKPLPNAKQSKGRRTSYRDYYNTELKELIADRFAFEIKTLNYSF